MTESASPTSTGGCRRAVVRSASITFLAFGMPTAMLGVIWPDVRERFDQSLGTLGVISLVYGLARMSTSGSGSTITRRLGIGPSFILALIGLVVVDIVTATASTWAMFLVGVAGIGIVSGLLDSIGAGVVATLGDVGSAGLIHGSYGVGVTIGPAIAALAPGWRWSVLFAASFAMVSLVVSVRARSIWPAPPVHTLVGSTP